MDKRNEQSVFARYRKIILAVILFMVVDSLVIGINFYNTYKADESALSINLSGRQGTLSQRITTVLLLMQRSLDANDESSLVGNLQDSDLTVNIFNLPPSVVRNLKELDQTVTLFDTTLKGFSDGGIVTGGDGKPTLLTQVETAVSRQLVADTSEIWTKYFELLKPLLGEERNFSVAELKEAVSYAQNNNLEIQRLMNDLTTDLETVANKRASTLRIVLVIGIIVAFINFCYTVIITLRDLMSGDKKLAESRNENAEILATVHEGLFLLNKDKKLGTQFSESLPRMLHMDIVPGMDFMPILKNMVSSEVYESAVDYVELLLGERVKESLVASLNPLTNIPVSMLDKFGNTQSRYLSFFFNRALVDDKISHVLVTVQDVTDRVQLQKQVEQAKSMSKAEVETLLRLAGNDFTSLQQFIDNTSQALGQINEKLSESHDDTRALLHTLNYVLRLVHGIKGEAAALGIEALEGYAHACEQEMVAMRESGQELTSDSIVRVAVLLEGFYERYSSLANIASRLGSVLGTGALNRPDAAAAPIVHPMVEHVTHLAQRIATDHGKEVEISCHFDKLSGLPDHIVRELQSISIQLVRNALVHGIETPTERLTRNKPRTGSLSLWCEYLGSGLYEFTVRDDGRGIVPEHLRANFVKNGRLTPEKAAAMSDKEIAGLIFKPGISTADKANIDAGHGVGLDVVLEKVDTMQGGRLSVKSRPDSFTEFRIQFSAA
ncbi:MAG: Hpt domain-containing protein [Azoarcus sp.]|nr:Hpt domain-containing protein [Azoarcus sp.]